MTKNTLAESAEWLPQILRRPEAPDIEKFAIVLRPVAENDAISSTPRSDSEPVAHSASSPPPPAPKSGDEVVGAPRAGVRNARGELKCIGIVGTNRWSEQGMETGYCINKAYWGRGYATEAFKLFLEYYWTLEGESTCVLSLYFSPDSFRRCGMSLAR